MLEGMRKAQKTWLGKIILSILFGFLIVSFGIWGINDVFRGRQSNTVITAGKTEVPFEALQSAHFILQRQVEQSQGAPLTPREAQAMRLDQQALSQLVSQAVLDENARKLGLSVSDDTVRQHIFSLPAFQGALGFDRNILDSYLRNLSMTEEGFVADQKAALTRQQLGEGLSSGIPAPLPMQEFSFRLVNEKRDVSYYVLSEASAGDLPTPTAEQLEAAYQENKGQFRAPEYRSFEALVVRPDALVKPDSISDDDVRAAYENLKATRYSSDERREIQQIVFGNEQEAKDALDRLNANNVTFEALAAERKLDSASLSIGFLTKKEILDSKVADAAFSLAKDQVSGIVESRFGPTLLRVTRIGTLTFDDLKDEIKASLVKERAVRTAGILRDEIEDMTANARPFSEIAKEKNLNLIQVGAIDKTGRDMDGKPVSGLPNEETLVRAVFASDIGVDNASLSSGDGGYIWYHVTNITPSRDRTLDEIRPQITDLWKNSVTDDRLSKLATEQAERIKSPEDIQKIAAEAKTEAKSAQQLARNGNPLSEFGAEGYARIFSTPVGKPASVANGNNRIVFLVTSAAVPAFNKDDAATKALSAQLAQSIGGDLIYEYIGYSQKELGVTIDQNVARRLFSSGAEY